MQFRTILTLDHKGYYIRNCMGGAGNCSVVDIPLPMWIFSERKSFVPLPRHSFSQNMFPFPTLIYPKYSPHILLKIFPPPLRTCILVLLPAPPMQCYLHKCCTQNNNSLPYIPPVPIKGHG